MTLVVNPHINADQQPIVVTATRTAQIVEETLAPVVIINRDEIERSQAADVAELLRFQAGIDVARNGGPGQITSLFIRGTESNHVVVMVDGVKINPGTIGIPAVQNISPDMIERIEIVKGPRSALYGSEAIGGVINIITRQVEHGTQTNVSVGGGSNDTLLGSVAVHHGGDIGRFGLTVTATETDGFPTKVQSDIDNGHDNTGFQFYAGTVVAGVDVELRHWQTEGNTEYLDFSNIPVDQDFENIASSLSAAFSPHALWASTVKAGWATDKLDQNQSTDFAHTERLTLDWQNDVQASDNQLITAGLYFSREDTSARVFGAGFDERTHVTAIYLQDDISWGDHRVIVAARYTDNDDFGNKTTGNLEYGLRLAQRTVFTAGIGSGFRAPDATDRFGFGGNVDLDPETSRHIELGVRHTLSKRHRLSVHMFDTRIHDLIEWDGVMMNNIGRARIRGVEGQYHWTNGPWNLAMTAIAQDPVNEETNEPLARRAEHTLTTSLVYNRGRYQLGADILMTSKRTDSGFSDIVNPAYELVNLTAQLSLSAHWQLQGRVENLFNEDYVLVDGFNTQDRAVYAQISYSR